MIQHPPDQTGPAVISGAGAQQVDLVFQSGEPLRRTIHLNRSDGTAVPLVGAVVRSEARFGRDSQTVIDIGAHAVIEAGDRDRIVIDVPVEAIPTGPREGCWDLFLTLPDQSPRRILAGHCRIVGKVTR